jgi:hypothetical protein
VRRYADLRRLGAGPDRQVELAWRSHAYHRFVPDAAPPETAYYYPEPFWLEREGGWVKSLLLFFDEIAILLPTYMRERNLLADPTLEGQSKNEAF